MLLFFIAYVVLTVAAFWVSNSENSKATEATKLARESLKHAEALDAAVTQLKQMMAENEKRSDESYKKLVEVLLSNDAHGEKLKQKVEWLEMKANNTQKASLPSTITLRQDAPLKIGIVYRQAQPPKKITAQPISDAKVKKVLIDNMKKKVKELSQ